MTYLPFARKYRPRCFAEMVGQSHILKALTHALEHNRLHHAYLLTGTRGVGKTSLARILAKCFNCEKSVTASPCGECAACQAIDQGRHTDVLEIDAASRTKVEDTRDLLENIQYAPQQGRFKIYIIDEVHMLSGHSFNALLKTLEEPPAHVKFVLATTDPQKLPVTVLSRCLQFHLKNISISEISRQLEYILHQENKEDITYEKSALDIIAGAAQGSMRDALSLLDQCLAHGEGTVQEKNVHLMLGGISEKEIIKLLDYIHTAQDHPSNKENLLKLIDEFEEKGADFFIILDRLLSLLQKIALLQFTQSDEKKFEPEDIQLYYQIALLGKRDLPLAPDPKTGFTMVIIRMAVFKPVFTPDSESKKMPAAPISLHDTSSSASSVSSSYWPAMIDQLKLSGLAKLLAQNCVLTSCENHKIELTLDPRHAALLTDTAKERLKQALCDYRQNAACQLSISLTPSSLETPIQLQTRETSEKTKALETTLLSDKTVQSLMQTFSATLVADSISTTDIIEE